jgi:alpha-galactosidase
MTRASNKVDSTWRRLSAPAMFFTLLISRAQATMGNCEAQVSPHPLRVLRTHATGNGFHAPPRGWNSFGLQQNPRAIQPNTFTFDQTDVLKQADALAGLLPDPQDTAAQGDYYVSLDSGWSIGDHGDAHGRIAYETTLFDIPSLARTLHQKGLRLGVYVLPGAFEKDGQKPILGTQGMGVNGEPILIRETWSGNNNGFARMDFDFSKKGVQEWHDSVVHLFAEW